MSAINQLAEVMATLRSRRGCPWDREQTHESLKRYLLEEAHEVLEAVDAQDADKLAEELGDLLLQIVFHAQIAAEQGAFDLEEVAERIVRKLRRRHPHVFGELTVEDAEEVLVNWERLKREEAGYEDRRSALDGVPKSLPALMHAAEAQKRAARLGFDWDDVEGPIAKVEEELDELKGAFAAAGASSEQVRDELGDLLFAVVNAARWLGVDAEDALRRANARFRRRFEAIERAATEQGRDLAAMSLAEMDQLWDRAKSRE